MEVKMNLSLEGDDARRFLEGFGRLTTADDTECDVCNQPELNPGPGSGHGLMSTRQEKRYEEHVRLTAGQKTQWARERRDIVNETITQDGPFKDALIIEHVKGTLYKVLLPSGSIVNAKHKKQATLGGDELGAGWEKWVDEKRS